MEPGPKVLRPRNSRLQDALDYCSYGVDHILPKYDDHVPGSIAKCAKLLKVHIKTNEFDSFYPISILGLLSRFKDACDKN